MQAWAGSKGPGPQGKVAGRPSRAVPDREAAPNLSQIPANRQPRPAQAPPKTICKAVSGRK